MTAADIADVASAAFKRDPFTLYARWRADRPVVLADLPRGERGYLVSRYDDVSALLKDARLVKDPANARAAGVESPRQPPRVLAPLTRNMLALDDPDHARLKRLVQAAFTPRRVEALEQRTRETADRLLARSRSRRTFDLIADFALPLPVAVISELLGIPERDRARFARWSHAIIAIPSSQLGPFGALPAMLGFMRYLRRLVAAKRAAPGDDLVSALVEAEAQGERLDEHELLAMIAILLSAGHETTTNLIGNGTLALLRHDRHREWVGADPTSVRSGVEELLRFAGPVEVTTPRYAREPLEIAGRAIPQGAQVYGIIASANRDESRFAHADSLDLDRAPNRHLTFGEGGHYCVGAALARMEGCIALPALFETFPSLRLAEPDRPSSWRPGLVLRGMTHLHVTH